MPICNFEKCFEDIASKKITVDMSHIFNFYIHNKYFVPCKLFCFCVYTYALLLTLNLSLTFSPDDCDLIVFIIY